MQMISMPNGIEVHSVNDHDHVVHVAGDDDDNADDDASQCCPNKIVKCPTTHTHTGKNCLATVRCRRPSCFTVLLTIKLLLCILKLMHKVHAPGETHTHTHSRHIWQQGHRPQVVLG